MFTSNTTIEEYNTESYMLECSEDIPQLIINYSYGNALVPGGVYVDEAWIYKDGDRWRFISRECMSAEEFILKVTNDQITTKDLTNELLMMLSKRHPNIYTPESLHAAVHIYRQMTRLIDI